MCSIVFVNAKAKQKGCHQFCSFQSILPNFSTHRCSMLMPMHIRKPIFSEPFRLCTTRFSRNRSRSNIPLRFQIEMKKVKQNKLANFHAIYEPILCKPAPPIASETSNKKNHVTRSRRRKPHVSADGQTKMRKEPPNYKFLGGEPKKPAGPYVFLVPD